MADFWVQGIVSHRDGLPYVQLSNEKGMIAQLTTSQTRQIAMDMIQTASRSEADAMIVNFFKKSDFPDAAAGALLVMFRDFRHDLDMDKAERGEDDRKVGGFEPEP